MHCEEHNQHRNAFIDILHNIVTFKQKNGLTIG